VFTLAGTVIAPRLGLGQDGTRGALARLRTQDVHALAFLGSSTEQLLFGHHGGLLRSDDGGRNWRPYGIEADAMALAVAGESIAVAGHEVLLVGDGDRWERLGDGLPNTDVHAFARDPSDPKRMWAWLANRSLHLSADGGRNWERIATRPLPFLVALSGPPSTLLGLDAELGLVTSGDDGRTWTPTGTIPSSPVLALAASPDGGTVVMATGGGLFRSNDRGQNWQRLAIPTEQPVRAVAVSDDGSTIVAVDSETAFFRSDDGGASW
jgi:photosystem II stability/assembly factor-like uncharacterized protein